MRLRARPRQRRGAAPELPVRRPRQRVPAAGLRDEPGPAARRAGGCRGTRHAGRAPAPGGRVMLRGTQTPEALTLAPPLVPLPSQSVSSASRSGCFSRLRYCFADLCTLCGGVLSRPFTGAFGLGTRTVSFRLSLRLTTRAARESVSRDARSGGCETAAIRAG